MNKRKEKKAKSDSLRERYFLFPTHSIAEKMDKKSNKSTKSRNFYNMKSHIERISRIVEDKTKVFEAKTEGQ